MKQTLMSESFIQNERIFQKTRNGSVLVSFGTILVDREKTDEVTGNIVPKNVSYVNILFLELLNESIVK